MNDCNCESCLQKCNSCFEIKHGFVSVFDSKFYCLDCMNNSWIDKEKEND